MRVSVKTYKEDYAGRSAELIFVTENKIQLGNEQLQTLVENSSFKGKAQETEFFSFLENGGIKNYILAGLGKEDKINKETYKKSLTKSVKEAIRRKLEYIVTDIKDISIFSDDYIITRTFTEVSLMAGYKFDKYKTQDKDNEEKDLVVFLKNAREEALAEGTLLAEATLLARNLINEPANIMTPEALAEEAKNRGREAGFQVEILDKDDIEDLGMGAFLAVDGIVGKGLMYDSGGLSIKPTNSMLEMKSDMSGAAAVIGAFTAIAEAGLKVNAVGVIAACENMISGKSYRPGDILTTMAGKTVFIGNTDAEGRLTLVDAIHYIIEKEKVSNIVDFATLTGAAVVALGDTTTAVLSNNDDLYNEIAQASSEADERIWRLPLFDDYKEKLKAKEADLTNSAGNPGTITAALFIEAFVQEKPWVHLDIAGTSWTEKEYDYYSAGGTGYGVRTIFHWLKNKSR
jgi:leucyl aminopeptidase